jgi:hypothetical protein
MSEVPETSPASIAGPRFLAMLVWLWLLVATPFLTDANCFFPIALPLAASWLVLGAAWLLLPFVSPGSISSRAGRRWYVATAASDPWVRTYVADVAPGTRDALHEPRWVGLFRVNGTEEYDGVVMLYTGWDFLNRQGVAHVLPGKSPPEWFRRVRHLYGPWYTFEWKF